MSGLAEIALGAALLAPVPYRRWAGLALAAYLVTVFPANVYVAVAGVDVEGQPGGLYPWLRLPWQALFVWLALWTTGFRAARRRSQPAIGGPAPQQPRPSPADRVGRLHRAGAAHASRRR